MTPKLVPAMSGKRRKLTAKAQRTRRKSVKTKRTWILCSVNAVTAQTRAGHHPVSVNPRTHYPHFLLPFWVL